MLQFILYYQEMVEIQSKNRFLGTFLGVFSVHPLTFKGFQSSRKLDFWLLLSGFSRITPPNEVGFVQNFHQ